MYPEATQRKELTQEYIQQNEIKPICSSFNVETYLKEYTCIMLMADGAVRASCQEQWLINS